MLLAARRAITLLQQQSEVDPARIGVHGHSMGANSQRISRALIRASRRGAVVRRLGRSARKSDRPSGGSRTKRTALELACVSDNAYIPRIKFPVLWLSPTNDFHAHIDNMAWNWRGLPDDQVRFSIAPHLNHRHTDEHALTEYLFFESTSRAHRSSCLKPKDRVGTEDREWVPRGTVIPDESLP